MTSFSLIVAMDEERGIGRGGQLPWHISEDLKYFRMITTETTDPSQKNAVIMGRKTWESIPENFRPLPDRINVVISHQPNLDLPSDVILASGLPEAFEKLEALKTPALNKTFVIGGQQIFELAIHHPACQEIHVTKIDDIFSCDTFFPPFEDKFSLQHSSSVVDEKSQLPVQFCHFTRNK